MVKYVVKRDLKEIFPKEFTSRALIGQFIDYIMNHFFQQASEKEINGYIGKKSVAMEDGDYYVEESTDERQNYQLTPALITTDEDNNVDTIVDYSNFINDLKLQGVDTNDLARIIGGKYWSWCPLINVDMFVNYNYYYWVEEGPTVCKFSAQTDVKNDIIGKSSYTYVDEESETVLSSGMRIMLLNDVNEEYNNIVYIVEGVGSSIILIDDSEASDTNTIPDYYVMERGCIDGNKWSKRNRWFHRSIIANGDSSINVTQAKKPILCFKKDMELYNHGTSDRGYVNFYYNGKKSDIHGKSFNSLFQGVRELEDGDRILISGDTNELNDNKIYEVSGKNTIKTIMLQPVVNGLSPQGIAVEGEGVNVISGDYANTYFYFDGTNWVEGQQKTDVNQSPLFKLFDKDGIALDNKLYYSQSSFKGSKLFDYKTTDDETATIDEDLDKRLLVSGYGNYIFENLLNTVDYTYLNYNETETIKGYKFVRINGSGDYLSDWHLSSNINDTYITTEIKLDSIDYVKGEIDDVERQYIELDLAYEPDESEYCQSSLVYLNGSLLNDGNDYVIDGKVLKIFDDDSSLDIEDYIYVKLLKNKIEGTLADGYFYDLPLALTANPLNKNITEIKYNECFDQLTSVISNQKGFTGNSSGNNNYIDTKQDISLGTNIIQHSHQILKAMLLNAKDETSVRNAISYVSSEYVKFKAKFRNVIESMSKTNEYTESTDLYTVITTALSKMNIGKEGISPFYNNGVCSTLGECYIPATPAYLGLDLCYEPKITTVDDEDGKATVLLCHDGSYQILFGDYRDSALLEMERQIYNSIPATFKEVPDFNKYTIIPGKFRTTDYSYEEYRNHIKAFFEQWCADNGYSYASNTNFSVSDPLTYNYSTCEDVDGQQLYGSYKSVYMYYYDTYRPHTHPWEMLGFGQKPSWWESHYGKAPYTSNNIPMWRDLENGYIADGVNVGTHEEFKRAGLVERFLPVDEQGNLKTPYQIGIVEKAPIAFYASKDWESGDMGNVELAWMFTSEYRYAIQTILYLMKPVEWIEENWETLGKEYLFKGTDYEQLIHSDTYERSTNDEEYFHNELIDDEYIQKTGVQQWISDYLVRQNLGITENLGDPFRSIDIRLFYRCGGYYKKGSLVVKSDNYGIIPDNNYSINMYKSKTSKILSYSAIMIRKVEKGYVIDGYNSTEPYFTVKLPNKNKKKTPVEINGKNVTYYNVWLDDTKRVNYKTVYTSVQELFEIICGYGEYLEDEGWDYITMNNDGVVIDFRMKAEDFLKWTSVSPSVDSIIILNPFASEVRIKHSGMLDIVGKQLNGVWTVLGTAGKPIYNNDLQVYRHSGYTDISTKTSIMAALRVNTIEYEHCILFDNETIYGEVLYDPLLCIKTQRFKINAIGANGWDGTLLAPGYLVQKDGAVANFDKLADDFNYIYDTDDIHSYGDFREMAKKTIGYQKTTTMENLLLTDRNLFDFYKGLLKEKGTKRSFGKLNRSSYVMSSNDSKIDLYDNWAFKIADFGYTKNSSMIELNIPANKVTQNPQIISFNTGVSTNTNESIIDIDWSNNRWLRKIEGKDFNKFETGGTVMNPLGGFLQVNDVDYTVADVDSFEEYKDYMAVGETIWVVRSNEYDWNVYKKLGEDDYISLKVDDFKSLESFDKDVLSNGDIIVVVKDVLLNHLSEISDSKHLADDSQSIVDKNAWCILQYNDGVYDLYRVQTAIIDAKTLAHSFIVNDDTNESLTEIYPYDPLLNVVPNDVLDEVNYITSYDPVDDYNDYYKWGDSRIGYLWWDTSKVRYLDYHQGDINYKRDNWGKQLPGSEIAIMEWVKSPTLPSDVTKYVHKEVWNSSTASYEDYYYYWTKNPTEIPDVDFRSTAAFEISSIINDPTSLGVTWFAPIDISDNVDKVNTFILCNFDQVTTGSDFVIQLNFKKQQDLNNHTEWLLVREGDDDEIPDVLWSKMQDSLLGVDSLGQAVPDPTIDERNQLGLQIRPRQTMFKDLALARRNFVDICNNIFSTRDITTSIDVGTNEFEATFLDSEEIPEYDYAFATHRDMAQSRDNELVGKTVLVESDEEYDNIWTLWTITSFGNFELKQYQTYNVQNYWTYSDLYKDDETKLIQPEYTFDSEAEMKEYVLTHDMVLDSYIKYYDNYGKWSLHQYMGTEAGVPIFSEVGLEDGAIKLNDRMYSYIDDEEMIADKSIFIDGMTKYEYIEQEARIVIEKIIEYFENV